MKIIYKRNPPQKEFDEDITSKYLTLSGGYGSGKSFGLAMKLMKLSYINRNMPGGCVCPSLTDFKKDLRPVFADIDAANNINMRYHASEYWYKFPWSKAPLQIVSAEKPLRGPNWAYAGLNEIGLISHERFLEAVGRVRIKNSKCPQIVASGTPEGLSYWVYEKFVEKPMEGARVIYATTMDNRENLEANYIRTLTESYDQKMLDAYMHGMFVSMLNNRFYYSYNPDRNDDKSIEYDPLKETYVTLDYNVSPMCATLWQTEKLDLVDSYGQRLERQLAYGQIHIEDGADTKMMSDALYARGLNPESTTIYPDPAGRARSTKGPPDNEQLKQLGWTKIAVKLVAPSFRKRQLAVNNRLEKGLIKIHPTNCPGIKRDFASVEQDQATLEKIKSNAKLTHYSDGLDYMVDYRYPLAGTKPQHGNTKIR